MVKFRINKNEQKNLSRYLNEDIEIARKFGRIMYKEFGDLIQCLILFGSAAQNVQNPKRDIDILIVLDDVRIKFTKELVETYRIITEKAIMNTDPQRLHIQSMKLSSFWEYVRAGDAVAINILRSGVALIDTGFFDPLQALLDQGRIRPSDESVWTYMTMSPASMHRSKQHLLTASVDLYWAAIDAAHAALMVVGETPPSPNHIATMVEKRLVKPGHVKKKCTKVTGYLYKIFKGVVHREIREVSGRDYDTLQKKADEFVKEMKAFVEYHKAL
jgi:predicted nucleotidyltransferase/uncharacterized protein (UPF0332 family)